MTAEQTKQTPNDTLAGNRLVLHFGKNQSNKLSSAPFMLNCNFWEVLAGWNLDTMWFYCATNLHKISVAMGVRTDHI